MKRVISLLLMAIMVLSMVSCGEKTDAKTEEGSPDESKVVTTSPIVPKVNQLLDIVKESKYIEYSVPYTKGYTFQMAEPFALTMAKKFVKAAKTVEVTLTPDKEGSETVREGKVIYFGQTKKTPKEFYKDLDAADYYVDVKDGELFVVGGSDYALEKAVEDMTAALAKDSLILPMTFKAPEGQGALKLRVATFNIQNGQGAIRHRFDTLAKRFDALNLDIVGLQEVDINTSRNTHKDTLKIISQSCGLKYYGFAKTIDLQGGEYGTAIISRYPIESFEVVKLDSFGGEARTYGLATINVNGVKVQMINTHLSWDSSFASQRKQQPVVGEAFMKLQNGIFTADVNDHYIKGYKKYFPECHMANGETITFNSCPGWGPFDNVITAPNSVPLNRVMVEKPVLSDHFMVFMDFVFTNVK